MLAPWTILPSGGCSVRSAFGSACGVSDVAVKAGVSRSLCSSIERGEIEGVTLRKLRRIAAVLEVRLPLDPRWRGAEVDRIVSSRHAAMAEAVTRLLLAAGWEVRPEVSFNHFGERGVVDLVAWHAASRTVLLVELKTELADVNRLLEVMDRRRRLASVIATPFGWQPLTVGAWVVLASGRTNERAVAEHRSVLRTAFPSDGRSVRGWLARPRGAAAALWFLPDSSLAGRRRTAAPRLRVRRARGANERP